MSPVFDEPSGPARTAPGADKSPQHLGEVISIRSNTLLGTNDVVGQSEARLRALLSSLDDLVFELDENGSYLAVWTTDESLLVAPTRELLGQNVRQALVDEIGRRVVHAARRALETGRPELLDYRLDVPAGSRWFQCRLASIVGSALPSVCLLVRDITIHTGSDSARTQRAVIRYRFDGAVATCTDRGSWRPPA